MKKYLFAIVLLSGSLKAQEKKIIFQEDFNNPTLDGWGVLDRDRDTSAWELSQGSFITADAGGDDETGQFMATLSYDMTLVSEGPLDSDDVLFSPVIKIPESGDINLTYKIGVVDTPNIFGQNMNDITYQLFVLEEGETFYPTLKPLDEKNFKNSISIEKTTINLNDYRGKSVRLYWRQIDAFGQYVLILDDIEVSQSVLVNGITVYPNPVENILYLGGFENVLSYGVYNSTGRLIKQGGEVKEIDVSDLATGVYIIVVEDVKGRIPKSFKFIKK